MYYPPQPPNILPRLAPAPIPVNIIDIGLDPGVAAADVNVLGVKSSLSENKLLIEGYIRIHSVGTTSPRSINIDNLVNVN